jgi:hypothetical protein
LKNYGNPIETGLILVETGLFLVETSLILVETGLIYSRDRSDL